MINLSIMFRKKCKHLLLVVLFSLSFSTFSTFSIGDALALSYTPSGDVSEVSAISQSQADIEDSYQMKVASAFDAYKGLVRIKEIKIEGNRLIPSKQIVALLKSKVGSVFDRSSIIQDLEAIASLGYFVHNSIQANPEQIGDGVLLKIRIEENSPITGVNVTGNSIVSTEEIVEILQELIGKPENLVKISEVLDQIERKYQERGFVLARVKDINLDPDGTITISIDEGIINKVVIKGNDKTKDKYIKRLIPNLSTGEPYNELLLVQDFRSLQGTGFFEDIKRSVSPSPTDPNKYDLTIEVKEKRTASFGFGGGVNTVSGAFTNFGFNNNNLFGEGKRVSLNTQLGSGLFANTLINQRFLSDRKSYQLEARYTDPNFLDTDNTLSIFTRGYSFNSYLVDLAQERNISGGISFTKPFNDRVSGTIDLIGESVVMKDYGESAINFLTDQLINVGSGKYIDEIIEKSAFNPGQSFSDHNKSVEREAAKELANKLREEQLSAGNYVHLNPALTFDTRDSELNTMSGWYNMVNVGQAVGIGADSFTSLGVDVRRYVPVGKKVILAFNLQGSSAFLGDVPMYSQFKPGGYYGVRGYRPFSDIGIGSRTLFASAEIRTPFLELIPTLKNSVFAQNIKLAFFTDLGYAGGNNTLNRLFNRLTTAASTGVGIRANIPMLGPIRVDYGLPLISPYWNTNNILGRFNFGFADRF